MKIGVVLPILIATAALGASVAVFNSGASPYLTVKEAKSMNADQVNLGVEIDKSSIRTDFKTTHLQFNGKDKEGTPVQIKYIGEAVDLKQAERVTCIGKFEGEVFVANKMLVKCPSKYEEEEKK